MKKKEWSLALLLAASLLFAGCGKAVVAAEEAAPDESAAVDSVVGKIKEVHGNEILLALGSFAQSPDTLGTQSQVAGEEGGWPPEPDAGGEEQGAPPDTVENGEDRTQGAPSGEGGMRARGGQETAARSQFSLSGGEERYLIPVTAPVTVGEGENRRELRFTQLAVKNVVRLQTDGDGRVVSVEMLQ